MEDDKMKKIIIAVLLVALIALVGCGQGNVINVQGTSELTFDPDEAEVWAGISVVKLTAEEAQTEANKVINAVVDGLRYKGITEDDIATEQLSLYEERRWENGKSSVVGWRATQTLKIKTTDLTKVGTIVDVCVSNGANTIQNINFGLSEEKEQEYKKQALAEATKNAKEKAETIAESLGAELGDIVRVSESNYWYAPRMYALEAKAAGDMAEEAAQILPEDVEVTGSISIVYEIKS